jgi:hypothetical protein
LGVHGEDANDKIVLDLHSSLNTDEMKKIFPNEPFIFSIEFIDPAVAADYAQFMNLDPITGILTISKPTVPLPEEVKLKMIEFRGYVTSSIVRQESNTIFYFASNPLYKDTLESDITLALTDVNSISYYGSWAPIVLK